MKLILFTSPTCKTCPKAKITAAQVTVRQKVSLEIRDITTNEGLKVANKYAIMSVPAYLLMDDKGQILWSQVGYQNDYTLNYKLESFAYGG
jgi:thioredoxin-related protein